MPAGKAHLTSNSPTAVDIEPADLLPEHLYLILKSALSSIFSEDNMTWSVKLRDTVYKKNKKKYFSVFDPTGQRIVDLSKTDGQFNLIYHIKKDKSENRPFLRSFQDPFGAIKDIISVIATQKIDIWLFFNYDCAG